MPVRADPGGGNERKRGMYHVQTLVGNTAELSPDRCCPNCGAMLNAAYPDGGAGGCRDVGHGRRVLFGMTGMATALGMAEAASERPHCIIVAGPNGAGKTTTALGLASGWHQVHRIVNPDEIAGGLSGAPELGALEAGKLALTAQARYIAQRQDFAMETTLAGLRWPKFLAALDTADYQVTMYYLWVADPAACIARVRTRVMKGGHGVSEDEIRRRYDSGLRNLQQVFAPRVDAWHVADANGLPGADLRYIAHGGRDLSLTVVDAEAWADLQRATRATLPKQATPTNAATPTPRPQTP